MEYIRRKFTINIPEEDLIKDLRRAARRLGRRYISSKEYKLHGSYDPATITRRFGGWNRALSRAGLRIKRPGTVPADELMMNLRHIWDTLGRQPRYMEVIKPLSAFNVTLYTSRWGSWNNALDEFIKWQKSQSKKTGPEKISMEGKPGQGKEINAGGITARRKKARLKRLSKAVGKGMRYDILRRDNFRCRLCGSSPANDPSVTLQIDHIIPRSKGGETEPGNLQTLCSSCNLGKGSKCN